MQRSVLLGEYEVTLDAKNRVAVPARLRPAFAGGIFLTRGFEPCILAYPPDDWDRRLAKRVEALDDMDEQGRMVQRYVFGNAVGDRLDGQGRIRVPGFLLERAGIARDLTVIGVQTHLEIWDRATWAEYRKKMEEGAHAVANQLARQQ
jgi:MraZ protein